MAVLWIEKGRYIYIGIFSWRKIDSLASRKKNRLGGTLSGPTGSLLLRRV